MEQMHNKSTTRASLVWTAIHRSGKTGNTGVKRVLRSLQHMGKVLLQKLREGFEDK